MKKSLVLALILLSFTLTIAQEQEKNYDEAFRLIEVWLQAQVDFENYPGLSAIIIKDQEELWSGAFGLSNIEGKVQMKTNTICSICSISKLFTSVAIMKLYDEGKLRLDDRVEDLLPWYNLPQQYTASGPITVRSLLTHSSGLPRESDYPYWNGPDFKFPTAEELRTKLPEQETLYPASRYFQYSNLGLTLLGEVVAEVSGMAFDEYVAFAIIDPLNLINTSTSLPVDKYGGQMAIGYSALHRNLTREKLKLFNTNAIRPAAGFSSTVKDLGKFASWQFRLSESKNPEILKPSTLNNMHNVHWTDPDFSTTWGLGFAVFKGSDGTKWVSHGGSCPGYQSNLQLNPKSKMAYSVMINANGTNPGGVARDLHAILQKVEEIKPSKDSNVNLEEYVGFFSNQPWWSESYFGTWNGKLVNLDLPSQNPAESMTFYEYVEKDVFRRKRDDGSLGETLTFMRDSNGKIFKAKAHGYIFERL